MRATNPVEEAVIALIAPIAADMGYRLVRVRLIGLKRKRLQIMAERVSDGLMAIEDCEALSRAINPVLDAADPVQGEYDLEVSSPGIDRPLTEWRDFARFLGHEAKVETAQALDGRRKFKGAILAADEAAVRLKLADGEATLPVSAITEARLVLTDALIEEDFRRQAAARKAEKAETDARKKQTPKRPGRARGVRGDQVKRDEA